MIFYGNILVGVKPDMKTTLTAAPMQALRSLRSSRGQLAPGASGLSRPAASLAGRQSGLATLHSGLSGRLSGIASRQSGMAGKQSGIASMKSKRSSVPAA